jgi:hypothetical protein
MKKLGIILGIIIGVLVIGVGAVAAYDYTILRDLVGLGLPRDPVAAVEKVNQNMNNVEAYHVEDQTNLSTKIPVSGLDVQSLSLPITVKADYVKPNKYQFTANLQTKELVNTVLPSVPSDLTGDINLKEILTTEIKKQLEEIKIDVILVDNKIYLRLPLLTKDTWVEFNQSDLSKVNKQTSETDSKKFLTDVINSSNIEKVGDEYIGGVKCYHFKMKLNWDKLLSSSTFKDIPIKDLQDAKDVLKNSDNSVDIYIGKRDLLVHKYKIMFKLTSPIVFDITSEDFYTFNQPVDIKVPENAKNIGSITPDDLASAPLGKILLKYYAPDPQTRDLERKADLKTIQDALKKYASAHQGKYPILNDTSKDGKFLEILIPKYLSNVFLDPLNNSAYFYSYKSDDGVHYVLSCNLENKEDPKAKQGVYQLTN